MQNKFQNLQNKFQSTVQGLNSNITDGATRLRQQLSSQTFLRWAKRPAVEGALATRLREELHWRTDYQCACGQCRQLRWYDNADLKILLKLHLKEKHELYMANAALREALQKSNRGTHMGVTRINSDIDKMVAKDAALSEFMVLAAGYEIDSLRKENELLRRGWVGERTLFPKAQYEAEMGRASAEEKLEKFQHMSSTQQAEIESLKGQQTAHVNEIAKMQSKIDALEKELSLSQKSSQQAASKSHEELSAKVFISLSRTEA
eukprot:jgi/Picre1/28102/NNA_003509.t1